MNEIANDILMHYGKGHLDGGHSGRYPWGSGKDPYQRAIDFLDRIDKLKKEGWSETPSNIEKEFGISTKDYRIEKALANNERRMHEVKRAEDLKADGYSTSEIGRMMGKTESTIRSYFNQESKENMMQAKKAADFIKSQVDEKKMVDVTSGTEIELGISKEKMSQALRMLEHDGYLVYKGGIPQATNKGKQINQMVICVPGTQHKDIYDFDKVHSLNEYTSHDGGQTFDKFVYPKSMDSKRLKIRYAEDGGVDKDGIIELRRGVPDLSLGGALYSQVRILVDDKKYLKGVAVYSDNMPPGIDVIFNTNKKKDVPKMDVLKDIEDDPSNPFGSLIGAKGQSYYIDKNGKRQLSLINKRADSGDWEEWKNALPAQFLSKQPLYLAKKQLNLAVTNKVAEYEDICALTNPTIKKHFLKKFSDECDSAAVHLQAAALPRQQYHVLIPANSLKDTEVYAPNYDNGTKLALIRYPHGGTFEIPILTVNNKNKEAIDIIGKQAPDAICINSKVAGRLSGADFDGDAVMCIPTHDIYGHVRIKSTEPLKGLEGFEPKEKYAYDKKEIDINGKEHYYRGGKEFRPLKTSQREMGIVSNLITDMTLKGATPDELAAAVRHSMVVIDAKKHKLDYRQSEIDNDILSLKKKYQQKIDPDGKVRYGASTLISRAGSETTVNKRRGAPLYNIKGKSWYDPSRPEGALIFKDAYNLEYTIPKVNKRTGEVSLISKTRTQKSTMMAETDDASTLISNKNTRMEGVYRDYANHMKSLANQARKEEATTGRIEYNKTAAKIYDAEVKSLNAKLEKAESNAPKERQAQRLAASEVQAKVKAYKEETGTKMKSSDVKKLNQVAIEKYRSETGAIRRKERDIEITDREWQAIQAGAISETKLIRILNNSNVDKLRERAMPKKTNTLSNVQVNRIKALRNSNYTLDEIAKRLGVSTSTVSKYLKGV